MFRQAVFDFSRPVMEEPVAPVPRSVAWNPAGDPRTLMYFSASYIVDWVTRHPIDWSNKMLTGRGGPGDKAGKSPTTSVEEFFRLLLQRRGLFTQQEYSDHCFARWREWLVGKPKIQCDGVHAKLLRNYYPSRIDSLHAWALLSESGLFSRCVLDSYSDAVSKCDITVYYGDGRKVDVALVGPSGAAVRSRARKIARSNGVGSSAVEITLPMDRARNPGNKRWHILEDFSKILP